MMINYAVKSVEHIAWRLAMDSPNVSIYISSDEIVTLWVPHFQVDK